MEPEPHGRGVDVTVRYFAGARAAAGVAEESLTLPPDGATVDGLVGLLAQRHGPGLARVLAASTFLLDEVAGDRQRPVRQGALIDVLPPFAGG